MKSSALFVEEARVLGQDDVIDENHEVQNRWEDLFRIVNPKHLTIGYAPPLLGMLAGLSVKGGCSPRVSYAILHSLSNSPPSKSPSAPPLNLPRPLRPHSSLTAHGPHSS